jgi:hypothetical protein
MNRETIVWITSISVILTGCAIWTPEKLPVAVELLPSAPVEIVSYGLRQEGDSLIISGGIGSLERLQAPSHVDLVVCTPNGRASGYYQALVGDTATRPDSFKRSGFDSQVGRTISRNVPQKEMAGYQSTMNPKEASFFARIEPVPPADSTIRLRYDAPPFAEVDRLECDTEKSSPTAQPGKPASGSGSTRGMKPLDG